MGSALDGMNVLWTVYFFCLFAMFVCFLIETSCLFLCNRHTGSLCTSPAFPQKHMRNKTHALVLADQAVGLGGDRGRRIRSGHDSCGDTGVWQETAPCQLHAATHSGLEELWLETSPQAKSGAGLRPQDRTL